MQQIAKFGNVLRAVRRLDSERAVNATQEFIAVTTSCCTS
jgi:hypothetical protein